MRRILNELFASVRHNNFTSYENEVDILSVVIKKSE